MDLHDHFKHWLQGENLAPEDVARVKQLNASTARLMERHVEALRRAFYSGAQAAQQVMVEVSNKPNLDAADVSTAMMRLQRQTLEGLT